MKYCETVINRMFQADYVKSYSDGFRIGLAKHALARANQRWFNFIDYRLLTDNIHDLIASVKDMEDRLMDIRPEDSFVITRESDGLTIFASYAYEQDRQDSTGNNAAILIFVHTVLIANDGQRIYVCNDENRRNSLLLEVLKDGTVLENSRRFRQGTKNFTA